MHLKRKKSKLLPTFPKTIPFGTRQWEASSNGLDSNPAAKGHYAVESFPIDPDFALQKQGTFLMFQLLSA